MHLQPALHRCVYSEGPDSTLIPLQTHWSWSSRWDLWGVTWCNHLLTARLATDAADFTARSHCSAFVQSFSNYREEKVKKQEAIPNPAIKLQRLPGSRFSTLEGMWWKVHAAPAISCWVAANAVSAAKTSPPRRRRSGSASWGTRWKQMFPASLCPSSGQSVHWHHLFFVSPHLMRISIHYPSPTQHTHPPFFGRVPKFIPSPQAAAEQTFLAGETQRKIRMEQHALQLASQVNKIRACSRFAATALRKVFQKPLSCEPRSLKSAPNLQWIFAQGPQPMPQNWHETGSLW